MICALVLAAGRSQRMGTQKLLLPLGGQPMITRIVNQVRPARSIAFSPSSARTETASSPRWPAVPSRSWSTPTSRGNVEFRACGLAALPQECTAALIGLGDQPGLTANTMAQLLRAFQTADRGMIVPTANGRRGHPLLVALRYRDEILTSYEAVGLQGLLQAHPEDVHEVEVGTPASSKTSTPRRISKRRRRRVVSLTGVSVSAHRAVGAFLHARMPIGTWKIRG